MEITTLMRGVIARHTAATEGYPVHIDCYGEISFDESVAYEKCFCHKCDRRVGRSAVVTPLDAESHARSDVGALLSLLEREMTP